jgi:4-diphosphocytidyl-2C-methyl-D-erythritol kinase
MPTAVRSHAKINLGLYVGAPRPDGFHSLATVYQTLELFDVLTVTARPAAATTIRLTSNDERVPTDARNTAWKMVALALETLGLNADVEIHIDKRLPVQGGLGAGSANAVAALVGLEAELGIPKRPGAPGLDFETWDSTKPNQPRAPGAPGLDFETWDSARPNQPHAPGAPGLDFETWDSARPKQPQAPGGPGLDFETWETTNPNQPHAPGGPGLDFETWDSTRRLELAAQVGSDVPLFLIGGAVLGLDRGQQVYPLPDFEPVWCVVALPDLGVSTPQAFRDWDALCASEGLTAEASTDKLSELSRAYASAFSGSTPGGRQDGSFGALSNEGLAGPLESALVRTGISSWIQNDFEQVVFPQHPPLAEIKRILAASDTPEAALHASLSGSGSALFGLYLTRGDAEKAQQRLKQQDVRSTITRTLPRTAYWSQMLVSH